MKPSISCKIIQPLLFKFRREQVFRHLASLEEEQFFPPDQMKAKQLDLLNELVSHTLLSHPVYNRLVEEKGGLLAPFDSLSEIKKLPIIEKKHLRLMLDDLKSSQRSLGLHTVRKTGGSSGEPCIVLADRTASARSLAARILCQGWHGIRLGDRQIRFWGRPLKAGFRQSQAKDLILNRIRLDSLAISPSQIQKTVRRIENFGVEYLYGYASLIQLLTNNITKSSVPKVFKGLKAVISTSETLLTKQRDELSDFFGCPVVNEYGCSEVDVISFTCPEGGQHVISSNLIVEVIRLGDEPEGYGQVVVTDLHNRLMPVIRYRLGDLVPLEQKMCSCGRGWPCLGEILGRSQGQYIILANGQRVHSQFVVYMLEELMEKGVPIGRFKIIQEKVDLIHVLIANSGTVDVDLGRVLAFCQSQGASVLGERITWKMSKVDAAVLEKGRLNKYLHFECKVK